MIALLFKLSLVFLACYLFLTPEGSVRFAILRSGNVKSAVSSEITKLSGDKNQSIYQLDQTIENKTGTMGYYQTKNKSVVYWSTPFDYS